MGGKNRSMNEEYPFEIVDVDDETYKKAGTPNLQQFRGVLVGPKRYYFHPIFKNFGLDFYNFESRSDDVWIMGVMRSGTTIITELAYLLINNLDFDNAAKNELFHRAPTLECFLHTKTFIGQKGEMGNGPMKIDIPSLLCSKIITQLHETTNRRCIRSHLPISLLSPHIFDVGAKFIYCARNPKDVIVSLYHLHRWVQEDNFTSFGDFFKLFKSNALMCLPYFEHLKEGWAMRNNPNFLFIFYEDIIKDKKGLIMKISNFLNIQLTETEVNQLENHLDFKSFKKNNSLNMERVQGIFNFSKEESFIRKGQTGDWKTHFTGDLEKEVDTWIEENLKETDIKLPD